MLKFTKDIIFEYDNVHIYDATLQFFNRFHQKLSILYEYYIESILLLSPSNIICIMLILSIIRVWNQRFFLYMICLTLLCFFNIKFKSSCDFFCALQGFIL